MDDLSLALDLTTMVALALVSGGNGRAVEEQPREEPLQCAGPLLLFRHGHFLAGWEDDRWRQSVT